jgi:hypothetical protein
VLLGIVVNDIARTDYVFGAHILRKCNLKSNTFFYHKYEAERDGGYNIADAI